MDIPESVVAAAEYVASWASENSRGDSWEIGRCASRHELIRLRGEVAREKFLREQAETFCQQVQNQREHLREALEELLYAHTDKAVALATAALNNQPGATNP